MPLSLWSIHVIRQEGLFLARALTLPLTINADRKLLNHELQEQCDSHVKKARERYCPRALYLREEMIIM